jgi:uncharacterized membrane protein
MRNLSLFLHLAAAIFWMGGMAFMVLAMRPSLGALEPPLRLRVVAGALRRFFVVVSISIAVLLATGGWLLAQASAGTAPGGWHAMAALGVLMMLIFGHIRFLPYKRLARAVAAQDWPAAGAAAHQVTMLVKLNLGLGWLAIAAVMFWR